MKKLNFTSKIDKRISLLALMLLFVLFVQNAFAQLKPVNASYYFNQYLMNPAMAGTEKILNGNIGYRKQLSSFDGAPQTQFLTADYGFDGKSGAGLKLYSDKAGLLRETALSLTYAYHLPLNNQDQLHFGLSGTLLNNKLNTEAIRGDLSDPDAMNVNLRKTQFDSDFGISYTNNKLTLQAVFPNMFTTISGDRANVGNYLLFFSSIGYKLETQLGVVEPKLAFRGVKGFKNIVDFGANLVFKSSTTNNLSLLAMYHSSKSATVGLAFMFNDKFGFNTSYTLSTTQLNGYTVGDLEIGIALKL